MEIKKPITEKVKCKVCKGEFATSAINEEGICIVCDRKIKGTD